MIIGKVITIGIIVLFFISLYLIDDMVDKRNRNK